MNICAYCNQEIRGNAWVYRDRMKSFNIWMDKDYKPKREKCCRECLADIVKLREDK